MSGNTSGKSLEDRLQALEDIEAIRKLKARYCSACDDDHNPESLTALFTEDAVWEASGMARNEGHDEIYEYFANLRASGMIRNSAHNAINPDIDVHGDTATGHWRLIMLYTGNQADGSVRYFRIIGWYREQYVRRNGRWLFKHLHCQVEENAPYSVESAVETSVETP